MPKERAVLPTNEIAEKSNSKGCYVVCTILVFFRGNGVVEQPAMMRARHTLITNFRGKKHFRSDLFLLLFYVISISVFSA
jgi:hypothetical protein